MSDVSDVENILVAMLTQALYPNGSGQASAVGVGCRIFRGWPIPKTLDADLAAGKINVSVYPQDNERNTTRYPRDWQELPVAVPGLTLTVAGNTITVGGTVSSPLNAAAIVNGKGYIYAVQSSDTLSSVATGLAALINVDTGATSVGPVITIGSSQMALGMSGPLNRRFGGVLLASMAGYWPQGPWELIARVGAVGSVVREIKRQKRSFQITFWCPTPALRDTVAPICDIALSALSYLSLPDGTAGRVIYERSHISDRSEKQGLYRRDLIYSVEYGTTQTQSAAQILTELFNLTGGLDPSAPVLKSFYT